jgi:positive regulator of sigma E activity
MREKGRVMAIKNGRARVEITSSRLSCCSGGGLCAEHGGNIASLEVDAPPGVKPGDWVTIDIPRRSSWMNALTLLIAPFLLLLGGVFLGYKLFPGDDHVNVPAILLGVALMIAWQVCACLITRRACVADPPRIVGIEPVEGENGDRHRFLAPVLKTGACPSFSQEDRNAIIMLRKTRS